MSKYLSSLHCSCCDCEMSEEDIYMQDMNDGLCEKCYGISMKAAYDDLPDLLKEQLDNIG